MALSFQSINETTTFLKLHHEWQEKAEANPSPSLLAVDLIFSHLLKSLHPCNFEVQPAKGFEKAHNLPTMTRQRISQALQDRVERGRKRAGGGVASFPRGPCMCKQLSLRPELPGINKLLRKQRTDLQPLFHEFHINQFTAEKSLLCHLQKLLLWDGRQFQDAQVKKACIYKSFQLLSQLYWSKSDISMFTEWGKKVNLTIRLDTISHGGNHPGKIVFPCEAKQERLLRFYPFWAQIFAYTLGCKYFINVLLSIHFQAMYLLALNQNIIQAECACHAYTVYMCHWNG